MPYYLSQFDTIDLPLLEASQAFGTGTPGAQVMPLVSGGAYRLHGTGKRPRPFHTLSATGEIDGTTWDEVQASVDALFALQGTYAKLWRTEKDDNATRYWTYAELLGVEADNTADYVLYQPVALSFALLTPYWYGETPASVHGVDLFDTDASDLTTTGAEGDADDNTVTFYLMNDGNLNSTRVRITVTVGDGTTTSITVANVTTGHTVVWAEVPVTAPGALVTDDVLIIDAGAERIVKYVLGDPDPVNAYSQFTEPASKERWFELAPGENVINVTLADDVTNDTTVVDIEADPTYG